jgi:hypothetical protein
MDPAVEIKDVYFRRFLVPIVISILILAAVVCVVTDTPGTAASWNASATVFGAQLGGALKKLRKVRG